jgi:aspartate kinase
MNDLPRQRNVENQAEGAAFAPVVMKFGGTSVQDAAALRRASKLVKRRLDLHPVLVISALAKVTDQLLSAGKLAAQGNEDSAKGILQTLKQRHEHLVSELVTGDESNELLAFLHQEFEAAEKLIHSIAAEGGFSPRAQDHLLGLGESFSSRIAALALRQSGLDTVWVDAKQCIITDAVHTQATPLWDDTNERLERHVGPLVKAGRIPVLGGFMGCTRDGIPTTLGRGGSDFSAAILGAGLQACRIEIWTDVDGIMTTDPRLCPDARRVPKMNFQEAAELAYFGAKVLHPATLLPAKRRNIPVWVLNSKNPESNGTEIVADTDESGRVKAVTAKRGISVVDVEPVRWLAPELLREIFEVFEKHHHGLDLLSASPNSMSLLVSSTAGLPVIAEELKGLAHLRWENHKALVSLVGEKIRRRPEIASQVFSSVADIEMRMICQGASERNISFLVDESQAEEAVRRLHKIFFSSQEAQPEVVQYQGLCQAGGSWQ